MNFGDAVEQMKRGRRVTRVGWGNENIWCIYLQPIKIREENISPRMRDFIPEGPVAVGGYFVIWIEQLWQPGWVPTQMDMGEDDWYVLPGGNLRVV